jgi:predicted phage tail protein
LNIILGAVLIVVGVAAELYLQEFGGGVWGKYLIDLGVGMIVGGVVQLLTPMPKGPKNTDSPENKPSYVFTGAVNTQAQGNPVPLLYGRMIVGSAVISAGINAEDYAPATAGVGPGYDSTNYDISDPVFGWNPKTPYDAHPALR